MNLPVRWYKIKPYKGPSINKMVHSICVILESPRELKVIVFLPLSPGVVHGFSGYHPSVQNLTILRPGFFPHETKGRETPKDLHSGGKNMKLRLCSG